MCMRCVLPNTCDRIHSCRWHVCTCKSLGLSANHHRLPIDQSFSRSFSLRALDALTVGMHASWEEASPHPRNPPSSSVECATAAGRRATPLLREMLNTRHQLSGLEGLPVRQNPQCMQHAGLAKGRSYSDQFPNWGSSPSGNVCGASSMVAGRWILPNLNKLPNIQR